MFPTLIGFFLSLIISLHIHSTHSIVKSYTSYVPVAVGIAIVFLATIFVFFDEWKYIIICEESSKAVNYNVNYVAYYLTYLFILSFVVSLSLNQLIPFTLYIFAAIVVLYFVFIIANRPYQESVHNIGLVINQVGVLFNLAWLISQNFIYLSRFMDEIIAFAIVAWMSLILAWSVLRIICELRKPAAS